MFGTQCTEVCLLWWRVWSHCFSLPHLSLATHSLALYLAFPLGKNHLVVLCLYSTRQNGTLLHTWWIRERVAAFAIINDNKKVLTGSQHEAAMKWWKVILHLLSEKDKKRGEEMQEHVDLVSLSLFSPPRWVEFCQVRYGAVRIHAHFLSYFSILPNLL